MTLPPMAKAQAAREPGCGAASAGRELFLTNVCGMHAKWMGEWCVGFMLMHALRMPEFLAQQRAGTWHKLPTASLGGATVAVVGFG